MAITIEEITAEVPRDPPAPPNETPSPASNAAPSEALLRQVQQTLCIQAERIARSQAD